MTGPARKPASKLPHLRKQMQKNQISKGQFLQQKQFLRKPDGRK